MKAFLEKRPPNFTGARTDTIRMDFELTDRSARPSASPASSRPGS